MGRPKTPKTAAKSSSEESAPGAAASRQDMLDWYRSMLLIRRFEERAGQLYGMGLIGGFCHLYIGQEAIAVGMQSVSYTHLTLPTNREV